ncbi:MAG: hypothetical protein ACREC4_02335 [Methylocella sp.]
MNLVARGRNGSRECSGSVRSARARAIDFLLAMVDGGGRDKVGAMTGAGPVASTAGPER